MTIKVLIATIVLFILLFLIELYSYFSLKILINHSKFSKSYWILYGFISIIMVLSFITTFILRLNYPHVTLKFFNIFLGIGFTIFLSKIIFVFVLFIGDIIQLVHWFFEIFKSNKISQEETDTRRRIIAMIGFGIAAIPIAPFLYGITKGKYNFKIKKIQLKFSDLPQSFDGFKLVQISDIHSGSFDDIKEVRRGIELINDQNPDAVVFTGDLVNNYCFEIEPYLDDFAKIKSKNGNFSITGNHDYGEYVKWNSKEEKQNNFNSLVANHAKMNFDILMNENRRITIENQSIVIAGVENWGKPPFPQYGDLNKAFEGIKKEDFTILLSHDPSHWDLEILDHPKKVHLTLSGHTHGMQFGVDIPGVKWSPVKWKYPRWAGLYKKDNQNLYVNKGFGFIGFPGRVGMWPEITVFELKKV